MGVAFVLRAGLLACRPWCRGKFSGQQGLCTGEVGRKGDLPDEGSPLWSRASGQIELLLACGRVF